MKYIAILALVLSNGVFASEVGAPGSSVAGLPIAIAETGASISWTTHDFDKSASDQDVQEFNTWAENIQSEMNEAISKNLSLPFSE